VEGNPKTGAQTRPATWGAMPAKVLIRHAKPEHHGFMLIAWGAMPHLSAAQKHKLAICVSLWEANPRAVTAEAACL